AITPAPDGDSGAFAFKTPADAHVGMVTWFRVFSGALKSSSSTFNANKGTEERIGQDLYSHSREHINSAAVAAGDTGGVSKLESVETGDTLTDGKKVILEGIKFPDTSYSASIHPHSQADLDKMSQALQRMVEEDPSLKVERDPDTGETIISGMGEPHVQIAIERMKRRSNIDVDLGLPRVPYRETIGGKVNTEYKHKKQSGGAGQYGHVLLELEPLDNGQDVEFADRVVGGSVPKNFFP